MNKEKAKEWFLKNMETFTKIIQERCWVFSSQHMNCIKI